jgi:hypothetical protein
MEIRARGEKRVQLELVHAFGASMWRGLRDSIGVWEEENSRHLLYPVGKFISLHV